MLGAWPGGEAYDGHWSVIKQDRKHVRLVTEKDDETPACLWPCRANLRLNEVWTGHASHLQPKLRSAAGARCPSNPTSLPACCHCTTILSQRPSSVQSIARSAVFAMNCLPKSSSGPSRWLWGKPLLDMMVACHQFPLRPSAYHDCNAANNLVLMLMSYHDYCACRWRYACACGNVHSW